MPGGNAQAEDFPTYTAEEEASFGSPIERIPRRKTEKMANIKNIYKIKKKRKPKKKMFSTSSNNHLVQISQQELQMIALTHLHTYTCLLHNKMSAYKKPLPCFLNQSTHTSICMFFTIMTGIGLHHFGAFSLLPLVHDIFRAFPLKYQAIYSHYS